MDPVDISDYPEIYFVFQCVSVPATLLNLFGLYVIWFGTPKRVGNYKTYLCYLQINAILYDLILVYLIFPVFSFPAGGAYSMGLLPKLGIAAWGQMSLGFGISTSFLAAIAIAFFSRQQTILGDGHWMKLSESAGKLICILIALHPLYFIIPLGFWVLAINDEEKALAFHYATHPIVKNFISQPTYYRLQAEMKVITVPAVSVYNSIIFWGFSYLIIPSYLQIRGLKAATTTWYAFLYQLGLYYLAAYSIWISILTCSHGVASTIVLFLFYGSYRRFLYHWFTKLTKVVKPTPRETASSIFVVSQNRLTLDRTIRLTKDE
ncbi:unnamed protein product, partial [Mesorhabditis spiculigera]